MDQRNRYYVGKRNKESHRTDTGFASSFKHAAEDLNTALQWLPDVEQILMDESGISGQLKDLKAPARLKRLHMRWCQVEGDLQDLKHMSLVALKLSGPKIRGTLKIIERSSVKELGVSRPARFSGRRRCVQ